MTLCLSWGCRCNTASSRLAAYEVLLMLGDSSLSNLRLITRELLFMHHQSDPSLCKEFDVRFEFVTEMQYNVPFNAIVFHL